MLDSIVELGEIEVRKEYNKLVRDRIPEIIRQSNDRCEIRRLSEAEYRQALREKLIEEAREAAEANDDAQLVTELADLYEVINAVMETYGISSESVIAEQEKRRAERGGFQQRIQLLWTEG